MAGHRTWRDIRNAVLDRPAYRKARAEIGQANDVALSLGTVRRVRERTDAADADAFNTPPTTWMTHPEGDYLTALRASIDDLGGTLEIAAVFPDLRVMLLPAPPPEEQRTVAVKQL